MDQVLAIPAAKTPDTAQFSLDPMALLWAEYKKRRARLKEDEDWCDQFTDALKGMSGDAQQFVLAGKPVANLVPGQLSLTKLAKELPDIHDKYVRVVTKRQFDRESFEKEEPELFNQFRARRFCVTGE